MSTVGKPITCRAAVAWEKNGPLTIEQVEVAPPKSGEVRVKIIACGVCRSDAYGLAGGSGEIKFPIILGHESAGIVESVGEGVTEVKAGDTVIPLFVPQCNSCNNCKKTDTNVCDGLANYAFKNTLPDGTLRTTCKGKDLYQFTCTGSFAEYTVVPETSIAKIERGAPLDKICLLGCCFPTGYGSALNTANVQPGRTCAVWGLGGVGLSVVQGCKNAGAAKVIGVDTNPKKFELAKQFGCTDFVNPLDIGDKKIQDALSEISGIPGGVDYAFDCVGGSKVAQAVFDSIVPGGGIAVLIGVTPANQTIQIPPIAFIRQKTITGSIFGAYKGKDSLNGLVNDYLDKKILLDELITHTLPLEKVNEAFQHMKDGTSIRSVLKIGVE